MPFTGPNYTIPVGTLNPAVVGTPISADDWNAFITDLQAALTDTLRATTQAFVGQVEFDPTGDAGTPALSFTGDTDTGIFQKAANEVGISTGAAERVLVKNAGVDITGVLAVSGNETVGGALTVTGNTSTLANMNVDGTLTVDGVSTLTGRVTLGAGAAGILVTDLPSNTFTMSEVFSYGPSTVAGDLLYHSVINATSTFTTNANSVLIAAVGPALSFTPGGLPAPPFAAAGDPTGYWLRQTGAPTGPTFLRITRAPGPAFNVWTEVSTINATMYEGTGTGIDTCGSFTTMDKPGAGTFQYRVEAAVSFVGIMLTIYAARLQVVQLG